MNAEGQTEDRPPQRPKGRFTLGQLMIAIGALAVAFGLARVHLALGAVVLLASLGIAILTEPVVGNPSLRARRDVPSGPFAYCLGVVAPTLCLVFDPCVFQAGALGLIGSPLITGGARAYCYGLIGLEMVAMVVWLWSGPAVGPAMSGALAGTFWFGAVFAIALGLLILPISVVGALYFFIGAFGFTPFLSATAYYLQGRLAFDSVGRQTPLRRRLVHVFAGAGLAGGLPLLFALGFEGRP